MPLPLSPARLGPIAGAAAGQHDTGIDRKTRPGPSSRGLLNAQAMGRWGSMDDIHRAPLPGGRRWRDGARRLGSTESGARAVASGGYPRPARGPQLEPLVGHGSSVRVMRVARGDSECRIRPRPTPEPVCGPGLGFSTPPDAAHRSRGADANRLGQRRHRLPGGDMARTRRRTD